jgi:hypothetical protein
LTPNYNETSFNRVVGSIDDAVLQQKVRNRRRCVPCKPPRRLSFLDKLLGTISASAFDCSDISISQHGMERMTERGITTDMIQELMISGRSAIYFNGRSNVTGFQLGPLFAVFTSDGRLITTFKDASQNYLEMQVINYSPI